MNSHPHTQALVGSESALYVERCREGGARFSESEEEAITGVVDLAAFVRRHCIADDAVVLREQFVVGVAQFLEELCRPLEVGEYERVRTGFHPR